MADSYPKAVMAISTLLLTRLLTTMPMKLSLQQPKVEELVQVHTQVEARKTSSSLPTVHSHYSHSHSHSQHPTQPANHSHTYPETTSSD